MSLATGITALATRVATECKALWTALGGKSDTGHAHAGTDITTSTVAYARLPVGTAASTVAAGDDARFTGAVAFSRLPVGSTSTTVTVGNDSRLSDARTPTTHVHAGADVSTGTVAYARLPVGVIASTVAAGDDTRLSDARTPLTHVHAGADVSTGTVAYARLPVGTASSTVAAGDDARFTGAVTYARLPVGTAASTVAAGDDARFTGAVVFSRLPTGTTSTTVAVGNDARFTDARTPTAHMASHMAGGADELDVAIVAKTASYTLTDADSVVTFDASGAARTATLPAASGRSGKVYTIKKLAGSVANTVTIDANASELIDGALTEVITASGGIRQIICDGTGWHVIDGRATDPVIVALSNVANAGTINCNAAAGTIQRVSTTGATATLAVPTLGTEGAALNIEITATAALALTINASILLSTGITSPISVVINKKLFLGLRYSGGSWYLIASQTQS